MSEPEGRGDAERAPDDEALPRDRVLRALRDPYAGRLLAAGVAIGAVAGVVAGGFDWFMVSVAKLVLGSGEPAAHAPPALRALIGPVLGGLVAGPLIAYGTRRGRPQGVPDVMARVQMDDHRLSTRDGAVSALAAAIAVGSGQSGGREGPIIQLASSLSARVCRWFGLRASNVRPLVAAGAAAAIAASFNTPLGGAFFALEIILGNFAVETFAPVVAATVTGTVVGQALLGDRIAIVLPAFKLKTPAELGFYLLLGVVSALVSTVFKRAVVGMGHEAGRLGIPRAALPAAGGLCVGVLAALGLTPILGNGYSYMEALLRGETGAGPLFLLALLVAKVVATSATAAGRTGAGLFAPSLFVGAVTGTLAGQLVTWIWPAHAEAAGAYGMVGMGAVTAAVMHAPITMTLMLFEMTGNYQVILPLLLALATAGVVSRFLGPASIYDLELSRQGIDLVRRREELWTYQLRVRDVMRDRGIERVSADAPTERVVERFLSRRVDELFVVDGEGRFVKVIDIQDAKRLLADPAAGPTAAQIPARRVPPVDPEQPVAEVLGAFLDGGAEELPVVDPTGRLVGVLAERDVVAAYHREVLRKDARLARVESGTETPRTDFLQLPEGQVMDVVEAGPRFAGRTIRDLRLPQEHACTVVAMSVWDEAAGDYVRAPVQPDRALHARDRLVVVGPEDAVTALQGA